ncbi:hypothetical protein SAMN05421747_1354 [Parapedobacter composti]|uniref:VIT domain-containing protein n=1 Tax=Parapedobacter composti TaxID=623281 RepID=A0A1I1MFZ0_9SPHI|nr:hypothetical protein [Parapedobacter composti]SFC84056.1 hypothetical protein SAMN05421747_1354 [Parapedobacter composti]
MTNPFIGNLLLFVVAGGLFCSCATAFREFTAQPPALQRHADQSLTVDYGTIPLEGHYAKRQRRSMCTLVYARVTNHTQYAITLAKDVKVLVGSPQYMFTFTGSRDGFN